MSHEAPEAIRGRNAYADGSESEPFSFSSAEELLTVSAEMAQRDGKQVVSIVVLLVDQAVPA